MADLFSRSQVLEMVWIIAHANFDAWQVDYLFEAAMFGSILNGYDGLDKQRAPSFMISKDVCEQYQLAQNTPCYFDFEIMEDGKPHDTPYIGCPTIGPLERECLHVFSNPILLSSIPCRK
ncbi:hypothetical protein J3F84DRAFT_346531 [Trichoderma pleuroticola]